MTYKRRNHKQAKGCAWQALLIPLVFLLTYWGNSAPVANPTAMVHPLVFVAVLGGMAYFLTQMFRGGISNLVMLLIIGIVAALIFLNGTDAMPNVDNPCPGDEVIIVIGGKCRGMDADANRAWLERALGR